MFDSPRSPSTPRATSSSRTRTTTGCRVSDSVARSLAWGSGPTSGNGGSKRPGDGDRRIKERWVADTGNNRWSSSNGTWLSKMAGPARAASTAVRLAARLTSTLGERCGWSVHERRIQRLTSRGPTCQARTANSPSTSSSHRRASRSPQTHPGRRCLEQPGQVFLDATARTRCSTPGDGSSSSTSGTFNFHANEPGRPSSAAITMRRVHQGDGSHWLKGSRFTVGPPPEQRREPAVRLDRRRDAAHGRDRQHSQLADRQHERTVHVPLVRARLDVRLPDRRRRRERVRVELLADGDERRPHLLRVGDRPRGNQSTAPATFSWTVDTTPPVVHVNSGPSGFVHVTNASFSFDSPDSGATFQCHLDGTAYAPCTSPVNYSGLLADSAPSTCEDRCAWQHRADTTRVGRSTSPT